MLFPRYRLVQLMLASSLILLVANVDQADAGLMSYLPSMRVFNPFYWYGSAKSNATQLVEDDISKRSDKCTDLNLCPSTTNNLPGLLSKNKSSSSNNTELIENLPVVPLKVSANNKTSILQVSTTRSPLMSTTTVPSSTTTTSTTITTALPTVAGEFTRGSIRNLFTTKKPNILIDKPTQWPKKFKILKNGKVYDMPGHMSVVDQNVNPPTSDNNNNNKHSNNTNYQYIVAYDSADDRKDNQNV